MNKQEQKYKVIRVYEKAHRMLTEIQAKRGLGETKTSLITKLITDEYNRLKNKTMI